MKNITTLLFLFIVTTALKSQPIFDAQDSLRGSLNENRDWFDIQHYNITVTPNYEAKSIEGKVQWTATTVKPSGNIQIDLQQPLMIDSVLFFFC